ncbi:MAG TPA: MmgE/PrpD family protein [Casimicrobiaceae bacterium]|nr:MmgE/PrpD family protein [Casimicrobiaceae bacterium]
MSDNSSTAFTHGVVDFVSALDADELSAAVRHECVRGFVNAVGCMVGGGRHKIVDTAHAALLEFSGPATASLLGRGEKTDPLHAALLNGTASAAYSYFDTYSSAFVHPAGPVAAGLLALTERAPVPGKQFLSAYAAGVEVACRLTKALAVPPAEGEMAWSMSGITCGPATALAVGKLLGVDAKQLNWALGIAASQAAGTRVAIGSMAGSLIFGQAAQTGLRSALLAAKGFTSTDGALEDRNGFAKVFARKANLNALIEGAGRDFELMLNTYKPYPCDVVIHPAIDAMLRLRRERNLSDSTQIDRVALKVSESAISFAHRRDPKNDLEAKFSLHHWVAAAAARGKAGLAEGRLAVVNDPEIQRLRLAIDIQGDPSLAYDAAELIVRLKSEEQLSRRVEHCVGSLKSPLSDAELDTKFIDQVEMTIGSERARDLLSNCWNLEALPDVAVIARKGC